MSSDRAEEYAARHAAIESYVISWWLAFRLIRALKLDPRSPLGRVANFVWIASLLIAVPSIVSLVFGQWDPSRLPPWIAVGVIFGVFAVLIYEPLRAAIDSFACIHRAMQSESDLDRMIEWDRRWFSMKRGVPFAAIFSIATTAMLVGLATHEHVPLAAADVALSSMLLFEVGEILFALGMLGVESRRLPSAPYALYRFAPMDTVNVRRALAGSNRLALMVGAVATAIIIAFAFILGDRVGVANWVAGALLIVTAAAVASGALLPRLAVRRIVLAQKERDLGELQSRLNALFERHDSLTKTEREEMARLSALHDRIRGSDEAVLPLRSVANLVGSLILPLITFLLTEAGRRLLSKLIAPP